MNNLPRLGHIALTFAAGLTALAAATTIVSAAPDSVSVGYQPMTATGLAAGHGFEAWFMLDKATDPAVAGYAVPSGATIRIAFSRQFSPKPGLPMEAVLLYGWPQKAIAVKFDVAPDPTDARSIVLRLSDAIAAQPPAQPGLKAIHLHAPLLNPAKAGAYPIALTFEGAGVLSGATRAVAHITARAVPNIAAYNQLHDGRDEDWQHVKVGQEAPITLDWLVNLPDRARASMSLLPASDGSLTIAADGKPIGSIAIHGVPMTLKPESFGPGYARLGIIRAHATAGRQPGTAEVEAKLDGGTSTILRLVVEP